MNKGRCPVCNSDIIIDDEAILGDMVTCANCQADLEITSIHPVSLQVIEEESQDELIEEDLKD
jgi:lysine biosynthesis protein LysW